MANTALIPFGSTDRLPAHIGKKRPTKVSALMEGVGASFVRLVADDGKWFIVRGKDDRAAIRTKGGEGFKPDVPVILVKVSEHLNRIFFKEGYIKGQTPTKPDCSSTDGIHPDSSIAEPQSKSCAACAHAVYGTGQNGKGFRCANYRRMAVLVWPNMEEPMMLQVPGGSLKALANYGKQLSAHGVDYDQVLTKVSFDEGDSKKLVFAPAAFLPDDAYQSTLEMAKSPDVDTILGATSFPEQEDKAPPVDNITKDEVEEAIAAPKKSEKVADLAETRKKKAAPKKVEPEAEDADEPEEALAPPPKKVAAASSDLDALLADFDD
jgi:hypothetical protein